MAKFPIIIICLLNIIGCTHSQLPAENEQAVQQLSTAITAISNSINLEDAKTVSEVLIAGTTELALNYRMVSPPSYHNLLVHMGIKQRGLCCHWAEDLHKRIQQVNQKSIKFDWVVTKHGSHLREHNSLVLYSANKGWQYGLIFDPWRRSGQPYWVRVGLDKHSWKIHPLSGQWQLLRCK